MSSFSDAQADDSLNRQAFDIFFEIMPSMLCIARLDGHFVRINQEFGRSLGYNQSEILANSFFELVHPDDIPATLVAIKHLADGKLVTEFINRYRHKNGSYRVLQWSARALVEQQLIYASVRDITEQTLIESSIRQNNNMLASVGSALSRYIVDGDSFNPFNTMLEHMLEQSSSEYGFIGEILHNDDGSPYLKTHALTNIAWNDETEKFFQENVKNGLEFRNLNTLFGHVMTTGNPVIANDPANDPRSGGLPPGHRAMTSFLGMPIYSDNKLIGMIGLANRPGGYDDKIIAHQQLFITSCAHMILAFRAQRDRRAAESNLLAAKQQAEAANKAKSNFLANISHELRTPLNAVLGLTELTLHTPLNEQQRDYLGNIQDSAESLLSLINEILDFSRIEAGRLELSNGEFSLRTTLNRAVFNLAHQANDKGVRFNFTIDKQIPEHLVGDRNRLRQVAINLISNAIKFTEKGKVEFVIRLVHRENNALRLNFEVRDTGIGIPEQQQQEIFQAFVQGDSSITRRYGGTGLGLTISSALVQLMGGQIHVISEVGKGSIFYFELDFAVAQFQSEQATKVSTPPDTGEPDLQPLTILIVEDNPMNQMLAVKILQNDGHIVDVADNGLEAIQKTGQREYDLILMDLQMPVMDGLEATRRIRESERLTGKHLPVIAMTAHALPEVKDSCIEAGMDDYIAKPVRRADLIAALTLTVDRFKLRHDA